MRGITAWLLFATTCFAAFLVSHLVHTTSKNNNNNYYSSSSNRWKRQHMNIQLLDDVLHQNLHLSNAESKVTVAVAETLLVDSKIHIVKSKAQAVDIMRRTLDMFELEMIKPAYEQGARLIVFPEYGLYGPSYDRDTIYYFLESIPNEVMNPCLSYPNDTMDFAVLRRTSCLAIEYGMYIVLNMGDVQYCTSEDKGCPSDKRYQYNTQVALSPNGTLLTKYHKTNLYYESEVFDAGKGKPVFFETEFGRVGLLICYDILFDRPALDLIYNQSVSIIAYSSWWVNFPPVLNGLQTQQGYSYDHSVTILGSNSGTSWKTSGSGIHVNGDSVASVTNTNLPKNTLLVGSIPVAKNLSKRSRHIKPAGHSLETEESDPIVSIEPFLLVSGKSYHYELTAGDVKCELDFDASPQDFQDNSLFMAVAASGHVWPALPCDICGIMRCGSSNPVSCLRVMNMTNPVLSSTGVIENISIHSLLSDSSRTIFPSLMTSGGQNLAEDLNTLKINHRGSSYDLSMHVEKPTLSAIVIGIHER